MAKTIATITGTALLPGVSANKRWYKPEHVAEAVRAAQERIKAGGKPMVMLTFHGADDNSREIAASLTDVSLNENGGMDFAAGFTDTDAGWNIARLADTTDGKPAHLKTVSIRGAWTGRVRKERGPSGEVVETADGVSVDGIDFTRSPGVAGAEIKTFDWVKDGASETAERVLITESVQEAHVTITEDVPPAPDGIREAVRALLPLSPPHVLANGICVSCPGVAEAAKDPKKPYGDVVYADPGYQKDGKKRYPLDSEQHVRAAWSYVNQAKNAALYTAAQLKRVKGRIKAAMGKIGATVAAEGWIIGPAVEVTEAVAEYYGDPSCAGSYSLSATNGPTTVTVCSYGCDPADLMVILAQACKGAGLALSTLDPDMDADIDLPGEQEESAPEDPGAPAEEASVPAAVTETAPVETPAPEPAAADRETEVPAMSETTTTEAVAPATAAAPALAIPQDIMDEAMRKAAKKAAKRALAATAPAESATAAPAEAVTETDEQRIARIVEERLAAARTEDPAAPAVTETEDQRIARIVEERLTAERQSLTAAGQGPGRKGLVTEHSAARAGGAGEVPENFPMKDGAIIPMEKWTDEQRRAAGNVLQDYVMGDRAVY